jgi:hypothetical protein
MRIDDDGMVVELDARDPRAARIRALLFAQPAASAPAAALWEVCSRGQRALLSALARRGEVEQAALEQLLGVDGVGLRGLLGGLSRLARRVGAEYPVRSQGARRASRRLALDPKIAREVLRLAKR